MKLSSVEFAKLNKAVFASGGINTLLRNLQAGLRQRDDGVYLTVMERDLNRIANYWQKTGGKPGQGGYQSRLPIQALRPYLRSVAPLFSDEPPMKGPETYVYFKREDTLGEPVKIKIGHGGEKRSRSGKSTDNPRPLLTLLKLVERPQCNEKYFHTKWHRYRIDPDQEWFWPAIDIMRFIAEMRAKVDAGTA